MRKVLYRSFSWLLCAVMLLGEIAGMGLTVGADESETVSVQYGEKDATAVTLPQDDSLTLTVNAADGAEYRWQICIDAKEDRWVNIVGQTKNLLRLSYAMVGSLTDSQGRAYIRCKANWGDKEAVSRPVTVNVSYTVKSNGGSTGVVSTPAVSLARILRRAAAAVPADEFRTHTITINYIYGDGRLAFNPYVATIAEGESFQTEVVFPTVIGYAPYFENETESRLSYTIDLAEVTGDVTYTVTYQPTLVDYTVRHFVQNILDDNYVQYGDPVTRQGLTGSLVSNCEISIPGFSPLWYEPLTIAADGSTEINVYYDRNYYLIGFDLQGGYGVDPVYARYETTVAVNRPTRPGYVFDGWELTEYGGQPATAEQQSELDLNKGAVTLPDANLKYTARWTTTDTTYTVVYWTENANDDNYSYNSSKTVSAQSGTLASGSDDLDIEHFTYNAEKTDQSIIVEGDGSTVVNVYYKRNLYTLKFVKAEWNGSDRICGKEEHTHQYTERKGVLPWNYTYKGGCYPTDSYSAKPICGMEEHTHSRGCYGTVVKTITAKYGADIHGNFPIQEGTSTIWWEVPDGCQFFKPGTWLGSIDTMPGENVTFTYHDTESGATLYYYLETLPGETGTYTHNGKSFKIYKEITISRGGYLTYTEEFHDIIGFTQWWADPDFDKYEQGGTTSTVKRNNYLCYTRDSYQLSFFNYNATVSGKGGSVLFEEPLRDYNFVPDYPDEMEANAYEFAGWYTSPGCYDGSEVDWDTATMPADDVVLFAKWVPKKHTVRIFKTSEMTEQIGETQLVPHGSLAEAPESVSNGNYVFVGWFYMDGTEKKAFDFYNMPVNRDLDIFAEWSSKTPVLYTIRYQLADGTEIAPPTQGSALAGASKTFLAKAGEELNAGYQEGYFPQTNSHTLVMKLNDTNEFIFIYEPRANMPYRVRYVDAATGEPLVPDKLVEENHKSVVTETFRQIPQYMPDAYQKRLVLSIDEKENVLTFYYTKDDKHAYYIVTHWVQNVDGIGYTEYRSIQSPGEINTLIEEAALKLTGFTYVGFTANNGDRQLGDPASGTLTEEGLRLDLYYDRMLYSYTVKYLEYGTNNELYAPETSEAIYRFGKTVSADALEIPGYTLVSATPQTRVIRTTGNEIIFYYSEKSVTISYVPVPTGAGQVSRGSETVKAITDTAAGSTPMPENGYRFEGWYKDAACTQPVDAAWVDAATKHLVPQKNNGIYESATYYAKFVPNVADLTIQKTGASDVDENQSFLFRIQGTDENTQGIDQIVSIHGNGKTTITALPVGSYKVTELTNWSWRYTPAQAEQTLTLTPEGALLTFNNSRPKRFWLDGDNYKVNRFGANQ